MRQFKISDFVLILYFKYSEIPVDLPEVESDSPIVVMVPTERRPFNMDGGGCGSGSRDLDFGPDGKFVNSIEKKLKIIRKREHRNSVH